MALKQEVLFLVSIVHQVILLSRELNIVANVLKELIVTREPQHVLFAGKELTTTSWQLRLAFPVLLEHKAQLIRLIVITTIVDIPLLLVWSMIFLLSQLNQVLKFFLCLM